MREGGDEPLLLCFGPFVLDRSRAELRRNGEFISLPPQPFRVLVLLASHADRLVTRQDIQGAVWGNSSIVDFERGLNTCIRQIRAALGDNADAPLYIRTVTRRGYRFIAPVSERGFQKEEVSAADSPARIHRNEKWPLILGGGIVLLVLLLLVLIYQWLR